MGCAEAEQTFASELSWLWSGAPSGEAGVAAPSQPALAGASRKPRLTNLADAKIMVVDDEPAIVQLIQKHLRDAGYRNLLYTNDPTQALRLAGEEHPDLLLFYDSPTEIEQELYKMFMFHRQKAFQGAIHTNPDYMHWYGWAPMKTSMQKIKALAKRMRKEHGKK